MTFKKFVESAVVGVIAGLLSTGLAGSGEAGLAAGVGAFLLYLALRWRDKDRDETDI